MRIPQRFLLLVFISLSTIVAGQNLNQITDTEYGTLYDNATQELQRQEYVQAITTLDSLIHKAHDARNEAAEFKGYNLLGNVYQSLRDTTKSREVYERALSIAQEIKNDSLLSLSYRNLGSVYSQSSDYLYKAIPYYQKSLDIDKRLEDDRQSINANLNISKVYLKQGKPEKAYPYLMSAKLTSLKDSLDYTSRVQILTSLGAYYTDTNKDKLAEDDLMEAVDLAFSSGLIEEEEMAQKQLAVLYDKQKKYEAAYYHTKRQLQLANELYKNNSQREIRLASAQFDFRTSERDLEVATREKEFTEKSMLSSKKTAAIFIIASALLFIAFLFIYRLYRSRKKYISRLREKNHQLIQAKNEAEQLSKLKTQFFSTISHELRTPLYGVIGIASILLEDKQIKTHRDDLKSLKFSADYLLALINDVLLMSKMEAKHITLEHVPYRLSTLLRSIARSFEFSLEQNNNKLHLHIDPAIPDKLIGDSVRLSQILMNLIGNAIKFNENGNIWVRIDKLVPSQAGKHTATFSIKDDGIGVPKESQASIFEEFSQVENRNYNYQGTGLGLPIVKKLLALYGSDIHLESASGEGATFSFTIDLEAATGTVEVLGKEDLQENQSAHTIEQLHILVVDDNKINQKITQKILVGKGFICSLANDGVEAVMMAREGNYDLILMDIHMPNKNGLEATEEIRVFDQKTPIVALTAVEIAEIRHKVQRVGMDDILIKPYDVSLFLNVILRNIEQKKLSVLRSLGS